MFVIFDVPHILKTNFLIIFKKMISGLKTKKILFST